MRMKACSWCRTTFHWLFCSTFKWKAQIWAFVDMERWIETYESNRRTRGERRLKPVNWYKLISGEDFSRKNIHREVHVKAKSRLEWRELSDWRDEDGSLKGGFSKYWNTDCCKINISISNFALLPHSLSHLRNPGPLTARWQGMSSQRPRTSKSCGHHHRIRSRWCW